MIGLDAIQISISLVFAKVKYTRDHVIDIVLHSGQLKVLDQITEASDNEFKHQRCHFLSIVVHQAVIIKKEKWAGA